MPNRIRGEIEARLGGRSFTLCLTLGALAELESAYGEDDLVSLAERFEAGRIGARGRDPDHRRGAPRRRERGFR